MFWSSLCEIQQDDIAELSLTSLTMVKRIYMVLIHLLLVTLAYSGAL